MEGENGSLVATKKEDLLFSPDGGILLFPLFLCPHSFPSSQMKKGEISVGICHIPGEFIGLDVR